MDDLITYKENLDVLLAQRVTLETEMTTIRDDLRTKSGEEATLKAALDSTSGAINSGMSVAERASQKALIIADRTPHTLKLAELDTVMTQVRAKRTEIRDNEAAIAAAQEQCDTQLASLV